MRWSLLLLLLIFLISALSHDKTNGLLGAERKSADRKVFIIFIN